MALCFNGLAQTELTTPRPLITLNDELPAGAISGQILTTDNKPASYVSVFIKENSKTTTTNENGFFIIKNLREGIYTLEISMVGLKTQQKTIEVKKDEVSSISIM